MNIKTYTFEFYSQSFDLEWQDYEYFSDDISAHHRQPLFDERHCLSVVLMEEGLLTDSDLGNTMTTTSIEKILLDNNIYVKFIEGED